MRKKYNDNSKNFADWTTKKLKDEYLGYHELIHKIGCYGISDLRMFDGIGMELDERGITIDLTPAFN
jgi:hypothetical protein